VRKMTSIIETIRKVAESEVRKLHIAELGVVTSVFPHSSDSDKENYECNVRLKDKDVELRKVPVATPHIGLADIPHVGDLVLLSFVNGDINSPIITGRLYNDEDRPPTSKMEEIVYKPSYSKDNKLRRVYMHFPSGDVTMTIYDDKVKLHVGKSDITIDPDGVLVETAKDIKMKADGDLSFKSMNIKLESDLNTDFIASSNMTITGSKVDINP
jgi:phage baseplate assembly protein gpV